LNLIVRVAVAVFLLSLLITTNASGQELPPLHGLLGYALYYKVEAPSEAGVNSIVDVKLTFESSLYDLYVYELKVLIYGCDVEVEEWLVY
jgi:hypothetical protein